METLYKTKAPELGALSNKRSKYITLVEKVYQSENKPQGYKGTIESLLWSSFSKMSKTRNTWKRDTYKMLLLHLYNQGCYRVLKTPYYIEVLMRISTFGIKMVRPVESWKRPSFDPDEQLEDLIDFCFAKYPTPVFLATAFYTVSLRHQLWYVQLGVGKSVKELNGIPAYFTSKMGHEFRNTPRGYDVHQALIRARALGYGATHKVADQLAWSRLTEVQGNDVFWGTVIQFFSNQKHLAHWDLLKLLEYLEMRIQRSRRYTMKGRTLKALENQAQEWHLEMQKMRNEANYISWPSSGILPLSFEVIKDNTKTVTYKTVELLNSDVLYEEGYDMNHCVADYIDDCYEGSSAIFSLRKYSGENMKKVATIEINLESLEILQIEGNCNTPPPSEALIAIQSWRGVKEVHKNEVLNNAIQNEAYGVGPPEAIEDSSEVIRTLSWILWVLFVIIVRSCRD